MKIRRLDHVALALRDATQLEGVLEDLFGLARAHEETFPQHRARAAMFPVGESSLELLEAGETTPMIGPWLAEHGEGIFHVCLEVDDIEAAVAELEGKGVGLLGQRIADGQGGSRVAFLDPEVTSDILFELVQPRHGV